MTGIENKNADIILITKDLKEQLEALKVRQSDISHNIDIINAKLQATADYTDDIIGTANNVLTHSDTVLTFYLGGVSFMLVIFGFFCLLNLGVNVQL